MVRNHQRLNRHQVFPRGRFTGPILFNIFINDLCHILRCEFLLFADDLKIFIKIKSPSDYDTLQLDIDSLYRWSVVNKLHLNIEKCHTMIFSNKIVPSEPIYFIDNIPLLQRSSVKDLGVIFDDKLRFDEHVDSIVKKSYSIHYANNGRISQSGLHQILIQLSCEIKT